MELIASLLHDLGLAEPTEEGVAAAKRASRDPRIAKGGAWIYRRSLRLQDGVLYFVGSEAGAKHLYAASCAREPSGFSGTTAGFGGLRLRESELSHENAQVLHRQFPFTAPVSLRGRKTTLGCGDRLGLATPGHVRALERLDVGPVLAQQSVRELTLARRDFPGVVRDVSFLVFQEGYEAGYGADGDHLKNLRDIEAALDAGMPMITLDLTEVMNPEPAAWSPARVDGAFGGLAADVQQRTAAYEDRSFELPGCRVEVPRVEARRSALMYGRALDFAAEVDRHLRARRGAQYDLEVSIDETTAPTLPSHHLFIASELQRRGVAVTSVAPRFVGEFQKGIDYIGDLAEFERQLQVHCAIAKGRGGYKISVHSGSDKFSVYPAVGRLTDMRLHLKTAGTSWLQALRVIARIEPRLFRRIVAAAVTGFPEASKLYHVTADPARVPAAETVADPALEQLLDQPDARQILHIAYGVLLGDPEIRAELYAVLEAHEEDHYRAVEEHIARHARLLGVPPRGGGA